MSSYSAIGQMGGSFVLVAAIDFGTTFSGYAFSFKTSPDDIKMNKNWGENLSFQSYKTPTSVLVKPNGEFLAFGFEAEQKYTELVEAGGGKSGHQMYRHFKMMLHESGVSRQSQICSTGGVQRNAMDIFAMSLRYLKDHLIATVAQQTTNPPSAHMIKWVITVPAIWSDEAKQFMREAAHMAEMIESKDSRRLVIALEPEAASLYCRNLDVEHFVIGSTAISVGFKSGVKYLVIDAGGGTVDITAHEVLPSGQVKEIHAANGGAWGGTKVDANFLCILNDILGERFMTQYKRDCPRQFLDIMLKFELAKKSVKPDGESKIVIPLSWDMATKYGEIMKRDIVQVIKGASGKGVSFGNGALVFEHKAVVKFFQSVTSQIVKHVNGLMNKPAINNCAYILLVGGFGQCAFLQKAIEDNFEMKATVVVPSEAQLSVIKGAVLFGHRPSDIRSRISKKTYGKYSLVNFVHGKHDPTYLITYDGIEKCDKLFEVFVQKDEEIEIDQEKTFVTVPVEADQDHACIQLYSTDRKCEDMKEYIDNPSFKKIGQLTVQMPDTTGGLDRNIDIGLKFGGTEIFINAKDRTSGNTANTTIDFMAG